MIGPHRQQPRCCLLQGKLLSSSLLSRARADPLPPLQSHCPYCSRAKSLLASLGQNPGLVELDQVSNGSTIQSYLAQRIGASRVTVPQVYIGGKLIGGNSEVQALHAAGQLVPLFRI